MTHCPFSPPSSQVMAVDLRIFFTAPEMKAQSKGNPSSVTALNFFSPFDLILVPLAANMVRFARLPVQGTASTWQSSSFGMTSTVEP